MDKVTTKRASKKGDAAVAKVIRDSSKVPAKRVKIREVDLVHDAVMKTLSEFMDSFVVMGYDFDGNPVTLSYTSDDKSYSAIKTLLYEFVEVFEENG